jgi:predicted anti-sigma-YlaC factor YlaD
MLRVVRALRPPLPLFLATLALLPGCTVREIALGGLSDALAGSAAAYAREDDPELVRGALPFVLMTIESLLVGAPEDEVLLLQACTGFTLYATAFVELDADALEAQDYTGAQALKERAFLLYLRARDHGLRALEGRYPGLSDGLRRDPETAVARLALDDLELAYWTAAAWGSAISLGLDQPAVAADISAVRALLQRAALLDEAWDEGALHEALISIESLPEAMGGSPERAREHYARALELTQGTSAGAHVGLAVGVALPAQDAGEFRSLLEAALAVDLERAPERRLANRISQRRARVLLERMPDLFLEPEPTE